MGETQSLQLMHLQRQETAYFFMKILKIAVSTSIAYWSSVTTC